MFERIVVVLVALDKMLVVPDQGLRGFAREPVVVVGPALIGGNAYVCCAGPFHGVAVVAWVVVAVLAVEVEEVVVVVIDASSV